MTKQAARLILALIFILVVALVAKTVITGGHEQVNLANAKPLTSTVSQALGSSDATNPTLLGAKDFSAVEPEYFNNRQWLVLRVLPTGQSFDSAILVFKKAGGAWQRVLGPSAEFSTTVKLSLPKSVSSYLDDQGVLVD